ncbi:hypothetical protein [Leisingera methylohalidivorans]|uniref:Uncharacterized protein n=1 Tax=Leisingera methylohalidivorans DSM 14336 TaxID=999552 RepID=V9VVX6_9RHOB|nr:hypothetical protein [Leisingera methylohalidivorans]AHD02901.1 hypothetical protein METH_05390 [Leisingera methylohalidivorans DSM 14336]
MQGQSPPGIVLYRPQIRGPHRSSANRAVLRMIANGSPISKISEFTGLCPRDGYKKIGFICDRVADHTARLENAFKGVNWQAAGRRFATGPQALRLNRPNRQAQSIA